MRWQFAVSSVSIARALFCRRYQWLVAVMLILCSCTMVYAKTSLSPSGELSRPLNLLSDRIARAHSELQLLHQQPVVLTSHVSKEMLEQAALNINIARAELASVDLELAEAQQTVSRLEKTVAGLQGQLNAVGIFGLKRASHGTEDLSQLHNNLVAQANLLADERKRAASLESLQKTRRDILNFYITANGHLQTQANSEATLQLKERQTHAEAIFLAEQDNGLKELAQQETQLDQLQHASHIDLSAIHHAQNAILFTRANVDFVYLKILLAHYQNQIEQLGTAITSASPLALLNDVSSEASAIRNQLDTLANLLNHRGELLQAQWRLAAQNASVRTLLMASQQKTLHDLLVKYQTAQGDIKNLQQKLTDFQQNLSAAMQQRIASRQGLPGLNLAAWLDLGQQLLSLPSLTFHVFKSFVTATWQAAHRCSLARWLLIAVLEVLWVTLIFGLYLFLHSRTATRRDYASLSAVLCQLGRRVGLDVAILLNAAWLVELLTVPLPNYLALVNVAIVWLVARISLTVTRIYLVETPLNYAGHDVRLYRQLRRLFLLGGIVTGLMLFMHQLPVSYQLLDLSNRLFLLFLLIAAVFLLRQRELLPGIILVQVDEKHVNVRRAVSMLGILIPLLLLINSVIGLSGFVNLVMTISGYESLFILVLVGYLICRGVLHEGMERVSQLLIRHVTNGWLWTEAFLKPLDKLLRVLLVLLACAVLFLLCGWDAQSTLVARFGTLLHYRLLSVMSVEITPLDVIKLTVSISLLWWAARWTREFVYRLLLSRTRDLGLRNSLAILSQYAMILIGILISLRLLGINLNALTWVTGSFAFGVGLGLRDLVNNFACGFLLLIERPLRIGDMITLDTFEGDVIHIGGRSITIRTWDHMDVVIPNTEIFTKPFTNWTAKDSVVRSVIPIRLSQQESPHHVQQIIMEALTSHRDVLEEPLPEVYLKEMPEGTVEFEVRYYLNLRQVHSRPWLRSEVLLAIWEGFVKHGVLLSGAQREVWLRETTTKLVAR